MRNFSRSAVTKAVSELTLIDRIRQRSRRVSGSGLRLGIGDDCALLRLRPGEEAAVTTDLSIDGRHFRLDQHPPEAIGHRALARGLSDIAAMGARPVAAFVSLGVPPELIRPSNQKIASWIERFYDGFLGLAEKHKTPLAGGDLAQSPIALADIVLIGAVPRGEALLRSGARPGDLIYVTGALGGSAFGLKRLHSAGAKSSELTAHLWPQPRITEGLYLRQRHAASAAIDISDGLSTDLNHLCEESGVSAEVNMSLLPLFPGAKLEDALHGGEDYELLFTAHPTVRLPRSVAGVPVTRIGVITRRGAGRSRVVAVDASGGRQPLQPKGWEHFRSAKPE
ncbi:MAG: thiamine-phosphate kinase [Acidobacteria bacterium]|nr:thiamine-phosphate kinase [Acidobacteriota bacterium]